MKVLTLGSQELNKAKEHYRGRILRQVSFAGKYAPTKKDSLVSGVAVPALGEKAHELWVTDSPVTYQSFGVTQISQSEDFTLVRVVEQERRGHSLEPVGYAAYRRLCQNPALAGLSWLRCHNWIPKILAWTHDLERYRQFNIGRFEALQAFGRKDPEGRLILPAATGIGTSGGPLVIECLATRHQVVHLQNPRQKPFIQYSQKYGKRAPCSSRGTLLKGPGYEQVFIAGTASILGEDTVWIGDPVKQTEETLRNIATLISGDNLRTYGSASHFSLDDLQGVRVYIKRKEDYQAIRGVVERHLPGKPITYVLDDICRPELLVEIEGLTARKEGM